MRTITALAAIMLGMAAQSMAANPPGGYTAADYCVTPALSEAERAELNELIENRLSTPARDRARAALRLAADDVARVSASAKSCQKTFQRGAGAFDKQLARQTRKVRGNAGKADSDDEAIAQVQQSLRDAFIADQAGRLAYIELATEDRSGSDFWAQRLAMANAIELDARHTQLMKSLLSRYDWIDARRFGNRIASHAWVLVQHADADPAFQAEALERMKPYLVTGGVRPRDYAYLYDRVAVNTGQLQRYGTQPMATCNSDGTLSPKPLEAPGQVDQRRAELGMEPMRDAMAEMAARRCSH